MAIHPDDPPIQFRTTRVVSTEQDLIELMAAYDSPSMVLPCTGSLWREADNDLAGIIATPRR
jgi:D-mannonate dehydratase